MGNLERSFYKKRNSSFIKKIKSEDSFFQKRKKKEISFYLVGIDDVGKTTLYIQFLRLENEYNENLENISYSLYFNLIEFLNSIYNFILLNEIIIDEKIFKIISENVSEYDITMNYDKNKMDTLINSEKFYDDIVEILNDSTIKNILSKKKDKLHVFDGIDYFVDNIERLKPKFSPSFKDTKHINLFSTIESKKTVEMDFMRITLNDISKKLLVNKIKYVDSELVLLFVVALSDYNQSLKNDEKTNRLLESLDMFDTLANGVFKENKIYIIFNKIDIFEKKLKTHKLSSLFNEYNHDGNCEKAKEFLKAKFLERNKYDKKRVKIFFSCAISDESMFELYSTIKLTIIN